MADSKITALTAISTVDPTADPLVIVDVSDTSMAASGTTKKSTINQLLGAGGTATLASATITGDLTVDTSTLKVDSANNRVGIGTATPDSLLQMAGAGTINWKLSNTSDSVTIGAYAGTTTGTTGTVSNHPFFLFTNNTERYRIASDGVATWSNVGGVAGTAMTMNATGLGVGTAPIGGGKISALGDFSSINGVVVQDSATTYANNNNFILFRNSSTTSIGGLTHPAATTVGLWGVGSLKFFTGASAVDALTIDASQNVGIGVTPSAWGAGYTALQNRQTCWFATSARDLNLGANVYVDAVGYKYIATAAASNYVQYQGAHSWYNAPSGTAGNAITFTQSMTLDASGRLIVNSSTFVPPTLNTNGELNFLATSNTNVRFSYRGTDGVTRVANITLA